MRKRKRDDEQQSKRFIEAAKEAEADESAEGFERAFKKVVRSKPARNEKSERIK